MKDEGKTREQLTNELTKMRLQIAQLEASARKYASLVENSPDMIYVLDPEAHFTFAGGAVESLIGFAPEDLIGKHFLSIIWPEDVKTAQWHFNERRTEKRSTKGFEVRLSTKEGEGKPVDIKYISVELYAFGIYDKPVSARDRQFLGTYGVARDSTEHKRAEEKLKEYSESLEEMVEERTKELRGAQEELVRQEKLATLGQLAGGVGHELRNPLGAIKNTIYFLNMSLEGVGPKIKEALGILNKEIETCDRIISSLLDFSRPEPPAWRKVDVNDIVQAALSRVHVPKNVEVVSQLNETLPVIIGDPDQLIQAFGNLTLNAIQAMPGGGRLVVKTSASSVEPSETPGPDWLTVSFSDTGVGISRENMGKVFEPLFTTKAKGIGLGLSLTKMLVKTHGGALEVQSESGKGSTFTVSFPTRVKKKKARILVADDDKEIRDILTEALATDRPYELQEASNGTEALIKLGTYRPDLLILDIFMPEMDGVEVCRAIKREPELSPMKVIIITGFPDHPKLKEVADLGFTPIHAKPVRLQSLLREVDSALNLGQ